MSKVHGDNDKELIVVGKLILSDGIAATLRERIISGQLTPGDSLGEERIAQDLNVSRTPVREAFRQLLEEGFVEYAPHRGVRVLQPTPDVVRQVLEIREGLEGVAARHAATLIERDRLTFLRGRLEELRGPVAQGDLSDIGEVIHNEVLAACGNERLLRLGRLHITKSAWVNRVSIQIPGLFLRSYREHQAILCALEARDPEWAQMAMSSHIRRSLVDILQSYSEAVAKAAQKNDGVGGQPNGLPAGVLEAG